MAQDMKGNFHLSGSRARMADRLGGGMKGAGGGQAALEDRAGSGEDDETPGETAGMHIMPHPDGAGYQSKGEDGDVMDHPTLGHALMHVAGKMEPDSKHAHVEHDGYEMTSHEGGGGGEVSGPHSHENMEALKAHLGRFLNEEEHEGGGEHDAAAGHAPTMSGEDLY